MKQLNQSPSLTTVFLGASYGGEYNVYWGRKNIVFHMVSWKKNIVKTSCTGDPLYFKYSFHQTQLFIFSLGIFLNFIWTTFFFIFLEIFRRFILSNLLIDLLFVIILSDDFKSFLLVFLVLLGMVYTNKLWILKIF